MKYQNSSQDDITVSAEAFINFKLIFEPLIRLSYLCMWYHAKNAVDV